jgi:hypothetical protein
MAEVYRAKTPAERLAIANGMWRSARRIIDAVLPAEHPDWSEEAINREIARRMCPEAYELLPAQLRNAKTV